MDFKALAHSTLEHIKNKSSVVGIIGLGYVGLPLAAAAASAGFKTIGLDIDKKKSEQLNSGISYIDAVSSDDVKRLTSSGHLSSTADMSHIKQCDVLVICVPTPLTSQREPDMRFIESTGKTIAKHMHRGQTIILESTTYPGTTKEFLIPILETSNLRSGVDFFVGFSPEREDPGNRDFGTVTIPKIVSGEGVEASKIVAEFYSAFIKKVVPVSSTATAEAVKITENIFRAVNIALVNELKTVYDAMGIDVWEVIDAAKTKPFGYMAFYPGPGLGGHCIPIDPFYLTWRAREFDITTRFIELAGEVNRGMPAYVIHKLEEALDRRIGKSLGRSRVLVLGLAYKKNVSDIRESPAIKIIELLEKRGAEVDFHDPHVPEVPAMREHMELVGRKSVAITPENLSAYDAVVIITDHDGIDYEAIGKHARLIVDTRNAMKNRKVSGFLEKA